MHMVIEYRVVVSLTVSAVLRAVGLHVHPFASEHLVLAVVRLKRPFVLVGFAYI